MVLLFSMEEDKIQASRRDADEQATAQRASILGITYYDMRPVEASAPLFSDIIDLNTMKQNRIIPISEDKENQIWQFGITTSTPQSYIRELSTKYNNERKAVRYALISGSSYKAMMDRYDPPVKVVHEDIKSSQEGDNETIKKVSQTLAAVGSDEILDYLVIQADKLQASDIHIENGRNNIRIRMRIDGVLHPVADLDTDRYRMIISALASRANLSTASKDPQSGHMQIDVKAEEGSHLVNLRVETIPTMYGQDAVLRLFNFDESMLNLDRLGLRPTERAQIDDIISHPRGMVLMVGPTGSGKSTTLYSMLNALNDPGRKIITLEDPIEYGISGISQIPVDTSGGQTFADGLRSILRLDPDVVMVGEIRDSDTAKTAIQASITGHLVLSSFHATSAAAAFSRMIDLIGVNPIFSSAIRLVIAQRLVRRLDDNTKEAYDPDEATRKWVRDVLADLPDYVEKPDLDNFKLYKPVVSEESPFGYKGRHVLMEQLVVNEDIQRFLRGDESDVNAEIIEKAAKKSGMVTLIQNGVLAAIRGETTLEEVNRTI